MIRRVEEQPESLRGYEYGAEEYEWFQFVSPCGAVYAECGLTFRGEKGEEAWLYWRIKDFSVSALKELRRRDVRWLQEYCRSKGAAMAVVASDDQADVNFMKMVRYMGFAVQMFGFQSLEAENVR